MSIALADITMPFFPQIYNMVFIRGENPDPGWPKY